MNGDDGNRGGVAKGLIWGVFLIALGSIFMLERFGVVETPGLWRLWPVVFFVIGVSQLLEGRPGSAVGSFLFGGWFLACMFDWMGLSFSNSWPLALVAVGASIVVKSLTGEERPRRDGGAS